MAHLNKLLFRKGRCLVKRKGTKSSQSGKKKMEI